MMFACTAVMTSSSGAGPRSSGSAPMDYSRIGFMTDALGEAASFAAITLLFFRFLDREEAEAEARTQGRADAA